MDYSCPVLPIHSRVTLIMFASLFCSLAATPVSAQQTKPDLTGTWKLNLSKSTLAAQRLRASDLYRIKHLEPRLEMVHKTETYRYVTDGKERVANRSQLDGVTQAKAYWDGDTLVIEKHQDIGGGANWICRYTLSQDGKSLAVSERVSKSSFGAAFEESLIYEKQK